ncbi:18511_t:CDS:2 [Dentiscutata erythropus]|uniref:18511_t:CDS:1 n=1 Tax=Dentiscutata erythropus TaxID=1348616 RepID=A0A9N9FQZ3_9GLOM|nr:18511_t:CDS:2 [Dentiscutata erythropus]
MFMVVKSEAMNNDAPPPSINDGDESTVEKIVRQPLIKKNSLQDENHMNENFHNKRENHVSQQFDSLNGPSHSNESEVNANTVIPPIHERNIKPGPPSESDSSITEGSVENVLSDNTAPTTEELREEGWGSSPKENYTNYPYSFEPNRFSDTSKNYFNLFSDESKNNYNHSPNESKNNYNHSPNESKNNYDYSPDEFKNNYNHSPDAPKDESIDRKDVVDSELQKKLHTSDANEDATNISQSSRELNDNAINKKFGDQYSNNSILFEMPKNSQNIVESDSPLVSQGSKRSNTSVAIASRGLPRELFSNNLYIGSIEQLPPIGLTFYWLGWYTEAAFTCVADKLGLVDRYTGIPLSKLFIWLYSPENWMGIKNEDLTQLEAARTMKLE